MLMPQLNPAMQGMAARLIHLQKNRVYLKSKLLFCLAPESYLYIRFLGIHDKTGTATIYSYSLLNLPCGNNISILITPKIAETHSCVAGVYFLNTLSIPLTSLQP